MTADDAVTNDLLLARNDERRGSPPSGARIPDAVAPGLPACAIRHHARVLAQGEQIAGMNYSGDWLPTCSTFVFVFGEAVGRSLIICQFDV